MLDCCTGPCSVSLSGVICGALFDVTPNTPDRAMVVNFANTVDPATWGNARASYLQSRGTWLPGNPGPEFIHGVAGFEYQPGLTSSPLLVRSYDSQTDDERRIFAFSPLVVVTDGCVPFCIWTAFRNFSPPSIREMRTCQRYQAAVSVRILSEVAGPFFSGADAFRNQFVDTVIGVATASELGLAAVPSCCNTPPP